MTRDDLVLSVLAISDGMTCAKLARAIYVKDKYARLLLHRLKAEGLVWNRGKRNKVWDLTDKGLERLGLKEKEDM